jgi:osmotically-inducible protein OsmY
MEVTVMPSADRIKEHIIKHLKWDNALKGSQIQVDYVQKTAVLSGTVPNLIAHTMAQRDALNIPGVNRVENRLTVEFSHDHPDKDDILVKSDAEKVLACTVDTGKQVSVSVTDGIVTLEGTIDSYWRKGRVEDLVASIDGVLEINNNIAVAPQEKPVDSALKSEIVSALARLDIRDMKNIDVMVKDGVVTLSGSVPTWTTAFDIEDIARYTSGVVDIKSNLSVE